MILRQGHPARLPSRGGVPQASIEFEVVDHAAAAAELKIRGYHCAEPPAELGISHWSARIMAERFGISFSSVARIWRRWNIQPHRIDAFKFASLIHR